MDKILPIKITVLGEDFMIKGYPPNKMLMILLVLVVMSCYFSFDLYTKQHTKPTPAPVPELESTTQPENQITAPAQPIAEAEGNRPENKTVSPNAKIIMQKQYTKCGHIVEKQMDVSNDMVNLTEEQLKLAYKDWEIKKFSPEEIVILQKVDTKCPDHFILKNKDGYVAVYYQTPINNVSLKEVTSIQITNLRTNDKDRLEKGIYVESQKELAQMLEDLGS